LEDRVGDWGEMGMINGVWMNVGSCAVRILVFSALLFLLALRRKNQIRMSARAARPITTPTMTPTIAVVLTLRQEEPLSEEEEGFADQIIGVAEPIESQLNPPPRFVTVRVWFPALRLSCRNCGMNQLFERWQ
jgi:hypothetical protein